MENEKELLEKLVSECESMSQLCKKLGKAISGAEFKVIQNKLDAYGIDYHFLNYKSKGGVLYKKSLDEIMVENSSYKSSDLKKRLIEEGLKEDKCELCGQGPYWRDNILTLQLDHINGNHNDNRFENLRILCPNCHSQTETFGNKSRVNNKKYCPDCGCEIGKNSTYCRKCGPKHSNQPGRKVALEDKPTKEELLQMILTMTFTEIGRKYDITDNSIRKWCKGYGLPRTKEELRNYIKENNISITK